MKKQLESALQAIPVPKELDDAVLKGIQQAHKERKDTMTKTIKMIATAAAALAVSITAIGGARLISGRLSSITDSGDNALITRQLDKAEDFVDVSLLRQEDGGYKVVALLNENARDADFYGEIDAIRPAEFSIVTGSGETVAEGKPDGTVDIEASQNIDIITAEDGSILIVFDADDESQDYQIIISKLIGSKDGNDIIEFFTDYGDGIDLSFTPGTTVSYVEMDENGNFVYYDENGEPIENIPHEPEVPDETSSTFNFDEPFNETIEMPENGFNESVNSAAKISSEIDDGIEL